MAPSQEFQEQLAKTQADGPEVIVDSAEMEKGVKQLQGFTARQMGLGEEEMDWDAIKATCREEGFDVDQADALPDLTEEEEEELNQAIEEDVVAQAMVVSGENEEDKEQGEEQKKHVTKKRLYKPPLTVAASNKMRTATILASPRKRAPTKTGNKNGEGRSQLDGKGSSNTSSSNAKP